MELSKNFIRASLAAVFDKMRRANGGKIFAEVNTMSIKNRVIGKAAIIRTASRCEKAPADVRADIQEAIDAAWASEDPQTIRARAMLFPKGKPTAEEFVAVIARLAAKSE